MEASILEGYDRISAISSAFSGYSKIPKSVLDTAATRGSQVHAMIHRHFMDMPPFEGDLYKGYMDSFHAWWATLNKPKVLMQEERLYSHSLSVTGQVDLIIEDGILGATLIDWKCTYARAKHWEIQACGYAHLALLGQPWDGEKFLPRPTIPVDTIVFVRLDKNGSLPEVIEFEEDPDLFDTSREMYLRFMKDYKCNLENE